MRSHASYLCAGVIVLIFCLPFSHAHAQVRTIVFPIDGAFSFRNDFAEPRGGGTREHLGIDIIADKMTPVVAVADGTITFIAIPEPSWGYSITLSDAQGYTYRYLHLNNDTPGTDDGQGGPGNAYVSGLQRGSVVTKGQRIGWVGDSGNAEATVPHLHFEMRDASRTVINPYDSLFAAAGTNASGKSPVTIEHSTEATLEDEEAFVIRRSLREGMVDQDVVTLHEELKALGYYTGTITGTYDAVTREAVRRFQNEKKIDPTGIADALTRKTLSTLVKALSAPAASAVPPPNVSSELSLGARGETVRAVQQKLKELGYFSADVTGYFGPITRTAVIAFQEAKGIEPLGIVGPKTRAALDAAGSPVAGPTAFFTRDLEQGARGDDVRELQLLLQKKGYFGAEATGYFGPITQASVIAFQNSQGIQASGVVGPKTRAALNALR